MYSIFSGLSSAAKAARASWFQLSGLPLPMLKSSPYPVCYFLPSIAFFHFFDLYWHVTLSNGETGI